MIRISLLVIVFITLSCKERKGYVDKAENNGDPVYNVANEDEEMNKAIQMAKATYNDFLSALKAPDSLMDNFSVKMRFDYGASSGEHMWLADPYFKNDKLFGILNNDPFEVKNVKAGDTLEIVKDKVSDWMYVKNNKLVGGYTIRALYNKMSKKEQEEFKQQAGFELE